MSGNLNKELVLLLSQGGDGRGQSLGGSTEKKQGLKIIYELMEGMNGVRWRKTLVYMKRLPQRNMEEKVPKVCEKVSGGYC